MRRSRAALAGLLTACCALVGVGFPTPGLAAAPVRPKTCTVQPGTAIGDIWPQRRLDFQQVWGLTRGGGVTVAVVDSGVNFANPQMVGVHHTAGVSVIPSIDSTTEDCLGHGTAVTGIIAAQPEANATFLGVAPDVTIVPIKQTNTDDDKSGTTEGIAEGILAAISAHAQVVNISIATPVPTPGLVAAVRAARAAGLVIVAAAGNDGQTTTSKAYPAAFSTTYDNVIAVSATDSKDVVAQFSSAGGYVTVAAPGQSVPVPASLGTGYLDVSGTSFAAPYVTGTVALMLAAHRGRPLTPAQIRNRIEATADPPPADVPDAMYGYGIVNPYLAVTAVRDDSPVPASTGHAAALPAPTAPQGASHHLQHLALGLGIGLVALAVLVLVAAAILRGPRRARPALRTAADSDGRRGRDLVRR